MKKTITMLMSAAALTTANAELTINENLSLQGFIDMSAAYYDGEVGAGKFSDNKFSLDQVEIDFLFNYDKVTGRVDLQALNITSNANGNDVVEIEQAFATYALSDAVSFTAGRYQSGLGLEGVEPTELYQFSRAYTSFALGAGLNPYPSYNEGVKFNYTSDAAQFYLSLQDAGFGNGSSASFFGEDGRLGNSGNWGAETGVSFTPSEELKFFVGGAFEDATIGDQWLANAYVSHTSGNLTLGAEIYYGETDAGAANGEGFWAMVMANYGFTEQLGLTGRISYVDVEGAVPGYAGSIGFDGFKLTLSPSYAWTDNLLTVFEVSYFNGDIDYAAGSADYDELSFVVQQIFSF